MRRLRLLTTPLLALLLAAPPLAAQIGQDEYAARRDSVAERLGEGVLIAFGAPSGDDYYFRLRQLPAFDYLTGYGEPDAAWVLVHDDAGVRHTLFTARPTVRTQLYNGFTESPESLADRTGATVRPRGELRAYVDSLAATGLPFFELRDIRSYDTAEADSITLGGEFVAGLQARHPDLKVADVHRHVAELRARKSPAEVALLREAIAITDEAHRTALRTIEPGMREYQVQAAIEATFRSHGAGLAFPGIVGSGPNSTTLHYVANDRRMEAGDVMVMDIGAHVEGYAADITRTVPVSGEFTADQRAIYDLVLAAQKAAEAAAQPGGPAGASLRASLEVRLQGLAELGLIESPDATYDPPWPVDCDARPDQCLQGMLFMIHGISHGIGLEVHDPAQFYFTGSYQPGDVFTIEPGIYIQASVLDLLEDTPKNRAFLAAVRETVARYDDIGVRIEDDYLVTADGVERLSAAPREVEAIEAAMAEGGGGSE